MTFTKHIKGIRSTDINQQKYTFDYFHWKRTFSNPHYLIPFKRFHNRKITRSDVITEFQSYFNNSIYNPVAPFLLCMIWGNEGSRYGPSRTSRCFKDPKLKKVLRQAFEKARGEEIEQAF